MDWILDNIMKNKPIKKELVVICDFGASLNFTHHYQFIASTFNFIIRNYPNSKITILIPIASQINQNDNLSTGHIKRILLPITHFPFTNLNSFQTWITFIWRNLVNSIFKFNQGLCLLLSIINALLYIVFAKVYLIIFPTACPQSIRLVELLEFFHIRVSAHLHFSNTSEIRHPFGSSDNVYEFLSRSSNFKYVRLAVSFESEANFKLYSNLNLKQNFFFARIPSYNDLNFQKSEYSTHRVTETLDVLVMGRPHDPGRSDLIINSLSEITRNTKFIEQSNRTHIKIGIVDLNPPEIQIINSIDKNHIEIYKMYYKINFFELINFFEVADIIVLPYNPSLYSKNHSAMILLASDFNVPVITCSGASFSSDVNDFNIGTLFDYEESFSSALLNTITELNSFRFIQYRQARELENTKIYGFLGI